jgi:micrococcal nuclease
MKRSLTSICIILAIFFIAINAYITPTIAKNNVGNNVGNNTTALIKNSWQGTVVYVTDGDTLWVRPDDAPLHSEPRKIRIDGIDAPESCQLYGAQSTAALKGLVATKPVTVQSKRFDDYGRDVAKIMVNSIDAGGWMVRNGHAWSYHYRHSSGPYRAEEEAAIRARLGLFADPAAIEPRVFRREHGTCHVPTDASEHPRVDSRKRYK